MKEKILRYGHLVAAVLVLWLAMIVALSSALGETDGRLVYALDDAYIHMAMAKNLAQHGMYGVTAFEFSSSSSSPVWTLLLAFVSLLLGVHEWMPFLLNLLIASAILALASELFRSSSIHPAVSFVLLAALIFFTPFPALIIGGMEHLLHILLLLAFVWRISEYISHDDRAGGLKEGALLCVLGAAVVMTRFESYGVLFLGCFLLLLRKKWRLSAAVAVSAILPLVLYQAISTSHGWFWLPNSILIRTDATEYEAFDTVEAIVVDPRGGAGVLGIFTAGWNNLLLTPHVRMIVIAAFILLAVSLFRSRTLWKQRHVLLILFLAAALAHLQFGKIGHFYRYEAYVVAFGIVVFAHGMADLYREYAREKSTSWKDLAVGAFLLACTAEFVLPMWERGAIAFQRIPTASRNIYEQQYQMGLFLGRFYPEAPVAVNDIGAVAYLSSVRLLDLVGLASADVMKLKFAGTYTTESMERLCAERKIRVAVVYDTWLRSGSMHGVPASWQKVGEWKILSNVACASDVVSFYAVQPSEEYALTANLREYSSALPSRIIQRGAYVAEPGSLLRGDRR